MMFQIKIKWIFKVAFFVILFLGGAHAQVTPNNNYRLSLSGEVLVDTSDFFPLQDGNYWDFVFSDFSGTEYMSWKVMGDTLMPNGKTYRYVLQRKNYTFEFEYFLRKDTNIVYRYYGDSIACPEREYKYLDFMLPDSSVWSVCRDLGPGIGNARGIALTYYDYLYYTFFQKPLETKGFEDVYIDSTDTLWTPGDGSVPMLFSKGIGPVRIDMLWGGDFWLTGAIIDGQQFGTLVSIKDGFNASPSDFKISAYPNPFNSIVNFNFILPEDGLIELSLYNILGEMVSSIAKDYKNSGSYQIKFDAKDLPSGIYLAVLNQKANTVIQKVILLK